MSALYFFAGCNCQYSSLSAQTVEHTLLTGSGGASRLGHADGLAIGGAQSLARHASSGTAGTTGGTTDGLELYGACMELVTRRGGRGVG